MEKSGTANAFPPNALWSSISLWVAVLYLKDIKDTVSATIHLEKYHECETIESLEEVNVPWHMHISTVQLHSYKHVFCLNWLCGTDPNMSYQCVCITKAYCDGVQPKEMRM